METSPVVQSLLNDLLATSALGDEATAEVARRLGAALEGPVRLRLMEAMAQAAGELSHQLPNGQVEVRLAGDDVELIYVGDTAPATPPEDSALDARITLRLPESLKSRLERAAADEGISVNAWLVRALAGSVGRKRMIGNRVTGFAKS